MFPKDFIWGVACASYQCEGAWNEDGKGRNIWDDFTHVPGNILNGDTGDRACDSYHRWAASFTVVASPVESRRLVSATFRNTSGRADSSTR